MNFSRQLRLVMGEMTQEELAKLSGVPQSSIARYLSGARMPGLESFIALQAALPRLKSIVFTPKQKARRVSTTSRSKTKG